MPRHPAVRRKFTITECTVLAVFSTEKKTREITYVLSGIRTDEQEILRILRKRYETPVLRIATLVKKQSYNVKCEMDEMDYLEGCSFTDKQPVQ